MSRVPPSTLAEALAGFLPAQRWFGGKGRPASFDARPVAELPGPPQPVTIWVVGAHYEDGDEEQYQLELVEYEHPVDGLAHALVTDADVDGGHIWVYDALHDKSLTAAWLQGIRDETHADGLRFTRAADPGDIPVDAPSLVASAEQSNTSLMYGDQALLKVFRKIHPGVNPDIEVHAALAPTGSAHIARLLGSVHAEIDGQEYALAMAQEFLTSATDGWALATTSVRDLMAEADLHAEEAGGDFAGEAHRLGSAVASVHTALVEAFGSSEFSDTELAARATAMHDRLDGAVEVVPELAELAGPLHTLYDTFADQPGSIITQRIHGDLHLAQALRTYSRWVVIDFEGEPMATYAARRAFDTPLRDVAGMLRSFEYAGNYRVAEISTDSQLSYRAREWTARNRDAFVDGYAETAGSDPREHPEVLAAYEADKAVYEAVYEVRNRPTWLPIPLSTLSRLAGGTS